MKKLNKNNKGFSLVELLVVIAIMVVLVGVIAPTLLGNIEKARVAADIQSLDAVAGAVQDALADENAYTVAMSDTYKNKPVDLTTLINSSGDALQKVVAGYLAAVPKLKGTGATTAKIYVSVSDSARITVWATTATTGITVPTIPDDNSAIANVVRNKDTNYIVIR